MKQRSCFNCENIKICFVFRDVVQAITGIDINIDSDPGYKDIFKAIGNACMEYKS